MTKTIEHIRQEISALPPAEQFSLWRALGHDLKTLAPEDGADVKAAWEEEMDSRLKDIQTGAVETVPGEEFERRTRALFGELSIKREPRAVQSA